MLGIMSALHKDSFHASEGVDFDLECEAKVKFAYNHNVDIDTWVKKEQEANDFVENLGGYEYMMGLAMAMMAENGFDSDASDEKIDSHGA